MAQEDSERLSDEPPKPQNGSTPMRSGADLERASRIRQGKRVNFTPAELAERDELLRVYRDSQSDPADVARASLRLTELDYGIRPKPIPSWVRNFTQGRN